MSETPSEEARAFFKSNPELRSVDLLIADLNGLFRGKRVHPEALEHVYEDGILLAKSLFASDITGATSEYSDIGITTGDKDCVCLPISGTLTRIPWKDRAAAQLLMMMHDSPGTPCAIDPQGIVRRLTGEFGKLGLTPVVAIEMEFYLIDRDLDAAGVPQQTVSPVTGDRQKNTQVYSIADIDDYTDFIDGIMDATRVQRIPAEVAVAEYAPGQYEINLRHQADAELACRHGILLKRLIKGVAEASGYFATFMPKPFPSLAGNGTHVHVSLIDERGRNVFTEGGTDNPTLRRAVAGLLQTMPESMLIHAPGANSYRRFSKGMYVPMDLTWGVNNRNVALRIPSGDPAATRVEHRVAGADSNPYLLTASVLAGMLHGISEALEPPPLSTGEADRKHSDAVLADSWQQAIQDFESGTILRRYLGEEFCAAFAATKRQEYDRFAGTITPLEYEWYLRNA